MLKEGIFLTDNKGEVMIGADGEPMLLSHFSSYDGPDGERIVDKGKYMTIWKKDADGAWKVAADMFNTSQPIPTAEEADNDEHDDD